MFRIILTAILLMPLTAAGHNLLWADFDQLTNSTINIKQAGAHNEMYGTSSGNDFVISGNNETIDIDQVQTGFISYIKGNFECDNCSYTGYVGGSNNNSIKTTYLHTTSCCGYRFLVRRVC